MEYEAWVRHYGALWRQMFGVEMVVDNKRNGVDLINTSIKLKRDILAGKFYGVSVLKLTI